MMTQKNSQLIWPIFFAVGTFGFVDALYLTVEHFKGEIPPCTVSGCELVLTSSYAEVFGIPIALFGALFYATLIVLGVLYFRRSSVLVVRLLLALTTLGLLATAFLIHLQLFVIEAICVYCMFSALSSTLLWIAVFVVYLSYKKTALG